jgi:arylamine N-acetyltransferase
LFWTQYCDVGSIARIGIQVSLPSVLIISCFDVSPTHRAYAVGARMNLANAGDPINLSALVHLIILVQPSKKDNRTYVVDVGVGSSCLMRPLLLSTDPENFVYGMTKTERHRIVFEPREETSLGQYVPIPL